jgi:hypothetical protein
MDEPLIKKRFVFLDTEVFIQNNFDYSNQTFSRLKTLIMEKKISLITTPITIEEIKTHINSSVHDAKRGINEFKDTAKILRHYNKNLFDFMWNRFDFDEITDDFVNQTIDYFKTCGTTVISLDEISVINVFNNFFSNLPPFKEGSKKHEFPDAFAIAGLELWGNKNNQEVFVITRDSDWKLSCNERNPHLIWLENLFGLFQLVEFDDKLIAKYANKYFDSHIEDITIIIDEKFLNLGFYFDGSQYGAIIENENVDKVETESIAFVEKYLTKVSSDKLIYSCQFEVDYQADISYDDYSDSPFDHEEYRYVMATHVFDKVHRSVIITAEVEIVFKRDEPENSELANVAILEDNIEIYLDNRDEYPYK